MFQDNDTSSDISGSSATGTGVLLDSGRKNPSISTVAAILFRRVLSLIGSTPSNSLAGLIAFPVTAAVLSFLRFEFSI